MSSEDVPYHMQEDSDDETGGTNGEGPESSKDAAKTENREETQARRAAQIGKVELDPNIRQSHRNFLNDAAKDGAQILRTSRRMVQVSSPVLRSTTLG